MNKQIQLLDCTLRDGGLGLEDAWKNQISTAKFDAEILDNIIGELSKSNIDIVELGSVEITADDRRGFAIYQDIESISRKIPVNKAANQMYAALYRGPDTPLAEIPDWTPDLCEAVRVIIRYSELQKSLDFCAGLASKGYKVFVQPMLTMRYTEAEIDLLIDAADAMNAYALYFVDSYGYMQAQNIVDFFKRYDAGLKAQIRIGFHAHNNMNLAFANVIALLQQQTERNIIVDSCCLGMGQGAGNLQTEIIADYLNSEYGKNYSYPAILQVCSMLESLYAQNLWGYSVTTLLPALRKSAYKYSIVLHNKYGLAYSDINRILANIPEELRHRYTPENTEKLLQQFGYGDLLKTEA